MEKWLINNTESLKNKKIAITGTTGGLGKELCIYLSRLNADLVLVDRNFQKSSELKEYLEAEFNVKVKLITADLEDMASVKNATNQLIAEDIDIFIHNAGAYSIPRKVCSTGYDNVFQINFVSPYYIIKKLLPKLNAKKGKIVVVGSIAHNYSKADFQDIDFSKRKQASKVYGNAKRYLMYSLTKLFQTENGATLSLTHPGISFTGITNHYPKLVFAIIKNPMKLIFMKPKKACLSVLKGCFDETRYKEWIGPRFFNVWGLPKKKKLNTADDFEINKIFETAENIYKKLQ